MIGVGDSKLELGYQQTFSARSIGNNKLKAGYFTTVLAEEKDLNERSLCVVNDKLRVALNQSSQNIVDENKPLNDYSYMLFRLDIDDKIEDWKCLTQINKYYEIARRKLSRNPGNLDSIKKQLLPIIKNQIWSSPDLTKKDKLGVFQRIKDELTTFGLQSTKNQIPSLNFLAQQPYPEIDSDTKTEFDQFNQIFY